MSPHRSLNVRSSRWFSQELLEKAHRGVYEKLDKPALVISTVELLAVRVSLKVLFDEPEPSKTRVQAASTRADHRGNGSNLKKLVTRRFPSDALVKELAAYLKKDPSRLCPVDPEDGKSGDRRVGKWRYEELQSGARVRHRAPAIA